MFTELPSFLELPGYLNYLGNLGITRLFGNYQVILQITKAICIQIWCPGMEFVKRDGVSLGASGLSGPGRAGPSTGQGLAGPPPSNGFVADGH